MWPERPHPPTKPRPFSTQGLSALIWARPTTICLIMSTLTSAASLNPIRASLHPRPLARKPPRSLSGITWTTRRRGSKPSWETTSARWFPASERSPEECQRRRINLLLMMESAQKRPRAKIRALRRREPGACGSRERRCRSYNKSVDLWPLPFSLRSQWFVFFRSWRGWAWITGRGLWFRLFGGRQTCGSASGGWRSSVSICWSSQRHGPWPSRSVLPSSEENITY